MEDRNASQFRLERDEPESNISGESERKKALGDSFARTAFTASSSPEKLTGDTVEMSEEDMREPFGAEDSDDSYWTIYRMFAAEQNIGRLWTLGDIWDYLSSLYDMSGETLDTLEDALIDWGEFIETDAAEKDIKGTFRKHGRGYVFIRLGNSGMQSISGESIRKDIPRKAVQRRVTSTIAEIDPALQSIEDDIKSVLGDSPDGVVKQAEIKKLLLRGNEELSEEDLQKYIDELVSMEHIYKFRRRAAAYLALEPHETEHLPVLESSKEAGNREELFDSQTSVAILEALSATSSRFLERKQTISQLWASIHEDEGTKVTEEGLEQLKKACRQLQKMGLLESVSKHVYKVGLPSQGVKEKIQEVLKGKNPDDYLRQKFLEVTE